MKTFIRMLNDQSGASAAEYALILAIIGGAISNAMGKAKNCINAGSTATTAVCP